MMIMMVMACKAQWSRHGVFSLGVCFPPEHQVRVQLVCVYCRFQVYGFKIFASAIDILWIWPINYPGIPLFKPMHYMWNCNHCSAMFKLLRVKVSNLIFWNLNYVIFKIWFLVLLSFTQSLSKFPRQTAWVLREKLDKLCRKDSNPLIFWDVAQDIVSCT